MMDEEPQDSPQEDSAADAEAPETPEVEAPADADVADAEGAGDQTTPPAAEEAPAEEPAAAEEPVAAEEPAPAEEPRSRPKREKKASSGEPEAIPGAHLEPDLVLDESAAEDPYADPDAPGDEASAAGEDEADAPLTTIIDLAADARYTATGKRKSAVARVIIKPGDGTYTVNGRELDAFFPRPTLQRVARGPLETVGQQERLDVVAKIHGGGVSAQAGALRHGIARALVEADPNLRGELKRRGFLTRDPRVKERKKAGLKKARKRPQFSKR